MNAADLAKCAFRGKAHIGKADIEVKGLYFRF